MTKKMIIVAITVIFLVIASVVFWQTQASLPINPQEEPSAIVAVTPVAALSFSAKRGETLFNTNCASCHGQNASGKQGAGPPLIHKLYAPNHHADVSFQQAAAVGTRAHHWPFGDMPAVKGLAKTEVGHIITYVRALQRANSIY